MRAGDTVYRLIPSGTLFRYTVKRVHKNGDLTVEWETVYNGTRQARIPAHNFTTSPTEKAKPYKAA